MIGCAVRPTHSRSCLPAGAQNRKRTSARHVTTFRISWSIIAKLKAYGVSTKGSALIWSYLSGRRQCVKLSRGTNEWLIFIWREFHKDLFWDILCLNNWPVRLLHYHQNISLAQLYAEDSTISNTREEVIMQYTPPHHGVFIPLTMVYRKLKYQTNSYSTTKNRWASLQNRLQKNKHT